MRANDEELEHWAAECDSLAGSLKKQWYPAQPGMEMSKYDFWNLIAGAKEECGQDMDASLHWLYEQLAARGPQQAQNFHDILYGYQKLSYQYGLWTAASLMCENVCDHNDFSYFRGWLITQGREVYLAALADPDSLTDVEAYGKVCGTEGRGPGEDYRRGKIHFDRGKFAVFQRTYGSGPSQGHCCDDSLSCIPGSAPGKAAGVEMYRFRS